MFANLPRIKFASLALLLSCDDSTGVTKVGPPAAIEVLSDLSVSVTAGSNQPAPITVLVKDASGQPLVGAPVYFELYRRVYAPAPELRDSVFLAIRHTDAAGVASLVPELPTVALEYEVRAHASAAVAGVRYYVRPAEIVAADLTPDTVTITGPVHLRAVLLRGCGRDRFGNCTNDGATFRSLTDSTLGLEQARGPGLSNAIWVSGLEVGDGAVVVTIGPYSDTAFVRVR